jgi:hypothetical protein
MIELRADAITASFKDNLGSMKFIHADDYENINNKLRLLADVTQDRNTTVEAAKWLWKLLFERSLGDITKNFRGYYELCGYFDEYANYENLLFALDDNHRDHVIHSIWVLLIGLYLRETFKVFDMDFSNVVIYVDEKKDTIEAAEDVIKIVKEHETSLWCLIALTHDLGYPIEKTKKANELMSKMVSNFGFLEQRDFSYNFTTVHQTAIESLLKTLSSVVVFTNPKGHNIASYSGGSLDFAKSFEKLDHGVMSAYLLQMCLDYICELTGFTEGLPSNIVDTNKQKAASRAMVILMLHAIAAHTNDNVYWTAFNQMPPFLLLCDELDEFSRYSHSRTGYEWVRMGCRTEFACTKDSFNIRYTMDNPNIIEDIEKYFKAKVGKLHNRFELEEGSLREISISCKDVRKAKQIEYHYKKKISDYPRGMVKKMYGKSCKDVQAFLDGEISLD